MTHRHLAGLSALFVGAGLVTWGGLRAPPPRAVRDEAGPPAPTVGPVDRGINTPPRVESIEAERPRDLATVPDASCWGEAAIVVPSAEESDQSETAVHSAPPGPAQDAMVVTDAVGVGGGAGGAGSYGVRHGGRRNLVARGGGGPAPPPPPPAAPGPAVDPSGFTATQGEGLVSSFAVDVDTASHATVRQALLNGVLPDPTAVRVEELVNAFTYEDAPPPAVAACPLAVRSEAATCPWAPTRRLVRIGLRGRDVLVRPPSNLVFLIDVSGSMRDQSRLPLAKRALGLLVRQLGENDRVAVVVYAGASGLALPSTACHDPRPVLEALDRLEAGGSTNGGAGIELAYRTAVANLVPGGTNRVVLVTDGDWNVGVTDPAALEALIAGKAKSGVFLTALGFGMGSGGDRRLETLADRGNGHCAYVDGEAEARRVLVRELVGTLVTVAQDAKVQVAWDPAQVAAWRLVGYEDRRLTAREFEDDAKDAGEVGAGHGVTALYEVVPREGAVPGPLGAVRLRWKEPGAAAASQVEAPLTGRGGPFEAASRDLRFAAAVATFGLLLRGAADLGDATLASARGWAEASLGPDRDGRRIELVALLRRAEALATASLPASAPRERGGVGAVTTATPGAGR